MQLSPLRAPDHSTPDQRRALIKIENIEKKFASHSGDVVTALAKVNLDIKEDEFISVVGPSGCGKTTLLRILAGLTSVTSGVVDFDGEILRGPRSDVGIVFQQALLLPWITVLDNVLLSPHLKKDRSEATRRRAEGLLAFMGLSDFVRKYPFELSGGMQQRVAICRALMREPKVLLMDEPFGALDAMTRESLNVELMRVCSEQKKTVLFITHSIPEAVLLGDRVVVMSPRPGRISEIIDVDIERPRSLKTMANKRFGEICDQIRTIFGSEAPMVTAL
ncbi:MULTISPECIES: ABC transporter ATP-binding protein [Rhodopseudomonas]|uniref:ABC transporter ATP-binding protein n=1 Tax=Rhodopseudomonas palustris TaxID=1076 RepID=A0A0D7F412_RHOPL|nr:MULTISPECIES: ABC transporter ATP-binding protein [Rhodopseudomonas]KIZ47799.1 ABC transporter ATP-binding protein [Rhodopseudomonas palustris]MDF3811023.1 ABC transporter ATP-binding protein [Rhodopseudomonas sp. BAL398]WOK15921.1 ABC transporter ATP-binding protein [Rhodopseudomonas sp. BAL398]